MSTLIVGAGICGLTLGAELTDASVWEKAKGVGGRLATRRTETRKFDHGAQFYSNTDAMALWHARWSTASLSRAWFVDKGVEKWNAPQGMTALAKDLAKAIDVHVDTRLERLIPRPNGFIAVTTAQTEQLFERVIMTCPLPQSLEILRQSGIAYDPILDSIHYAKALVALFELSGNASFPTSPSGYDEVNTAGIFSVANQMAKGVSTAPAVTVVMDPKFSDDFFEQEENLTLSEIERRLIALHPALQIEARQLKKWRYSHPLSTFPMLFAEVLTTPQLILAGDAFGGPSIPGAVRSAQAVVENLKGRTR